MRIFIALLLLASPATAAEPMTGAEFEAYTKGKVLDFLMNGEVYGTEEYLSNRRVRWAFEGEDCQNGFWYERAPSEICFIYDGTIDEQCWHYTATPDGVAADFLGDSEGPNIYVAGENPNGLFCPGPKVGV